MMKRRGFFVRYAIALLVLLVSSSLAAASTDDEAAAAQFQIALSYVKEKNCSAARDTLNNLIAHYPQSPHAIDAQWLLGYTYLYEDEFATALAKFQDFVASFPQHGRAGDAQIRAAFIYIKMKQFRNAYGKFSKYLANYPDGAEHKEATKAYINLSWFFSARAKSVEQKLDILKLLEEVIASNRSDEELQAFALMQYAALSMEIGRIEEEESGGALMPNYAMVAEKCREVRSLYPSAAPSTLATAALMEAECDFFEMRYDDAKQKFTNLIATYQSQPGCRTQCAFAQYMLGMTLFKQGKYDEAYDAFQTVRTLYDEKDNFYRNNVQASSLCWMAYTRVMQNRNEEAKTLFTQLVETYPNTEEADFAQKMMSAL